MTPEIQSRADEVRNRAKECATLLDLSRAMGWSMEIARHWSAELGLNLPEHGLKPVGPRTEGRANPKPGKKGAK